MKIVLVTGGFDPLHNGHLDLINAARKLGDKLAVGLNSDAWLAKKKGQAFMNWAQRSSVISNVKAVDYVIEFDDSDGTSVNAIKEVQTLWPDAEIVFANGGDRDHTNVPEMSFSHPSVSFVFAVGGTFKSASSGKLLEQWRAPATARSWGNYKVLYHPDQHTKLKELTVNPHASLSMQQHSNRGEFWFVVQGQASVYRLNDQNQNELVGHFGPHQHVWIAPGNWHQLSNQTDQPVKIIEIQYGQDCVEQDIVRK